MRLACRRSVLCPAEKVWRIIPVCASGLWVQRSTKYVVWSLYLYVGLRKRWLNQFRWRYDFRLHKTSQSCRACPASIAREPKRFFVLRESAGSCFSGLVFQLYNWRSKSLGPGSEAGETQKVAVQRHIGKHIYQRFLKSFSFLNNQLQADAQRKVRLLPAERLNGPNDSRSAVRISRFET